MNTQQNNSIIMKKTYTVSIGYIENNPITLTLESRKYIREIGFYKQKELESVEEFISREISIFLETIKDYREMDYTIKV